MKYIFWLLLIAGAIYGAVSFGLVAAVVGFLAVTFAVGTIGFYGLLAVCILAMWWIEATSWEDGDSHPAALALIPFAVWCIVVHFISGLNLITWVRERWSVAAMRVGLYLLIGFAFFAIRWVVHVVQKRDELDKLGTQFRQAFDVILPLHEAGDEVRFQFTDYLTTHKYNPDVEETQHLLGYSPASGGVWPTVRRNWRIISCWIFWWPFEIPRYCFGKLWQDIIRGLREFLANMVDWCSKRYFGQRSGYVLDKAKYEEVRRQREQKEREAREFRQRPSESDRGSHSY
jgi:hypothetical protein